jgi:hypothetical protein
MCNPRSEGTRTVVATPWRSMSMASCAIHVPLGSRGAAAAKKPLQACCIT